ncbi:MAG: hypothetical protein KDK39_16505 [Leptospiraceae bacterium]|nr:hypothetical protein [Leptospiraceae bacterium]
MKTKAIAYILIFTILQMTVFTAQLRAQEHARSFQLPSWLQASSGSPDIIPPPCWPGPEANGVELTIFGDSRAFLLSTGMASMHGSPHRPAVFFDLVTEVYGTINGATDPVTGQRIIADGQITHGSSYNLGWPGATATDSEKLDAPVDLLLSIALWSLISAFGPLGFLFGWLIGLLTLKELLAQAQNLREAVNAHHGQNNWNRRLVECVVNYHQPVRTSNKIVISIGGNDMKDFYEYLEGYEALYFFFRVITNPRDYLKSLLYGKGFISKWSKEAFWLWQFEVKEDAIVQETKSLISYHLNNQVVAPYTKPNEVMLISVAPTLSRNGGRDYIWDDLEGWIRLTFYLRRLRDKYQWEIVPHFTNERYAGRFHFLDTYDRFLHNIVWEWASFYVGDAPADGIHFTAAGNEQLGRMIAAKAVQIGWFAPNTNISQEAVQDMANGLVVNASDYCSASHPARCATQMNCAAFGNHWCNNTCQTTGCAVPVEGGGSEPPPGPDWGAIGLCFFFGWCG